MNKKDKKNKKIMGWLAYIALFAGAAFSMVAWFQGKLIWLLPGVICLVIGFFLLKQSMS